MNDTKKPTDPETGCAPLGRPYAETVSLEVVWAAAYAVAVVRVKHITTAQAVQTADHAVRDLLDLHPRGAR
jgi:hypothetical protein